MALTHRARLLAAIRGEPVDQVPWAPRMDLWCLAQRARGTLPPEFAGLDTAGIADVLGFGCHAVRADFTRPRERREQQLRGLGFDNHPDYPYRVEVRDLPVEFTHDPENLRTRVRTPAGDVVLHLELTGEMARNGISIPFVQSYALPALGNLEAVAQLFEHLVVIPTPDAYASFQRRIGDRGLAIANGPIAASPMHLLLHELMPMEQFFYLYEDEREQLRGLARRLEPFYEAMLAALLKCSAEVVFWGANYDQDLTWPPFFQEEIVPWLQRVSRELHAAGKLVLTHCDGENQRLLPHFPSCGFDIAESVCPAPMTRCTLAQLRQGFGPRTTVWGGIPSIVLLDAEMDDRAFALYLDGVFREARTGSHLILGVSDNVPPDVNLSRLTEIGRRCRELC